MPEMARPITRRARAQHIYQTWDCCARQGDVDGLLALYQPHAVLESPLIPILCEVPRGILTGHAALRQFFEEGGRRRPDPLVRWYREPQRFAFDGQRLQWEYPRDTPEGEQIGLMEVMDLEAGLIRHHRIYWDWLGLNMLLESERKRVTRAT